MFDTTRRVLLIRFGPRLTPQALGEMQAAAQAFVARAGACDGIIDLSAVTQIDVSSEYLAGLARHRAVLTGHRRVIVASKEIVFGLSRMFGTQQDAATGEAPVVVHSLDEAYAELGLVAPDFKPVVD